MSKHTPGPWKWLENENGLIGDDGESIFIYVRYEGMYLSYGINREANARLIASAPKLLQALEELADIIGENSGEDRPCVQMGRSVIAKAKGEQCSST